MIELIAAMAEKVQWRASGINLTPNPQARTLWRDPVERPGRGGGHGGWPATARGQGPKKTDPGEFCSEPRHSRFGKKIRGKSQWGHQDVGGLEGSCPLYLIKTNKYDSLLVRTPPPPKKNVWKNVNCSVKKNHAQASSDLF